MPVHTPLYPMWPKYKEHNWVLNVFLAKMINLIKVPDSTLLRFLSILPVTYIL